MRTDNPSKTHQPLAVWLLFAGIAAVWMSLSVSDVCRYQILILASMNLLWNLLR